MTDNGLTIKIKYHGDTKELEKIVKGDWIDLRAAEDVDMNPGDYKIISLGVSMKLPEGYEAHLVPRSSTYKKWGIIQANGIGVIDNKYSGTNDIWGFPAIALRNTKIYKGDRIAQFRIIESQPQINFEVCDKLDNEERGGFGSTGSN